MPGCLGGFGKAKRAAPKREACGASKTTVSSLNATTLTAAALQHPKSLAHNSIFSRHSLASTVASHHSCTSYMSSAHNPLSRRALASCAGSVVGAPTHADCDFIPSTDYNIQGASCEYNIHASCESNVQQQSEGLTNALSLIPEDTTARQGLLQWLHSQ